ncbi:MAG TPA: hypothetical protein VLG47_08305 [Candidatus Saccharimonadales bacterium]|nr:hypothetical protein [Candidatus Saccharimonadales bacterium]
MSLKQKPARHEMRRGGAGTGPKHRRPESTRKRVARTLNLRDIVKAHQYYRKDATAGRQSDAVPHVQAEQGDVQQKPNKPSRKLLKASSYLMVAALGAGAGGAGAEHIISERNPSPGSQAGIARQVGALAAGIYKSYNTVHFGGGSGNDTLPGKTIGVSVALKAGGTEYFQLTSKKSAPGIGGMEVPDPTSIRNVTAIITRASGVRDVTTYSFWKGQWTVSHEIDDHGRTSLTETKVEDGRTVVHVSETESNGTADTIREISDPSQIDASVIGINRGANQSIEHLEKIVSIPYQPPRLNNIAV